MIQKKKKKFKLQKLQKHFSIFHVIKAFSIFYKFSKKLKDIKLDDPS